MSKAERKEKGTMTDLVKGLAQANEEEELDDLIPVEKTTSKGPGLDSLTPEKIKELQALLGMLADAQG